jgi:hypothetical protein
MSFNGKKFFLLLLVMGVSLNLFAQEENPSDVKGFSFGSAISFLPDGGGSGAYFECGFLIFHNEKWDIRNHVFIGAARMYDDDGIKNIVFNLNEKISIGGITQNGLFRPYGFIEGGVGFYETKTKDLFNMPLTYNFGFGFGLDIFIRNDISFLIEGGINEYIMDKQWLFMPRITIGVRSYL